MAKRVPTEMSPPPADQAVPTPAHLPKLASPRRIAWQRRRLAVGRFWKSFRKSKMGMTGLIILIFFFLVAIFAPVLANPKGLDPTLTNGPPLAPPSLQYPLGTDDLGRSVLTLVIWGKDDPLFTVDQSRCYAANNPHNTTTKYFEGGHFMLEEHAHEAALEILKLAARLKLQ